MGKEGPEGDGWGGVEESEDNGKNIIAYVCGNPMMKPITCLLT